MRTGLPLPRGLQRSLDRIRDAGESLSIGELARRLLASAGPVPPGIARSVVAASLGRPGEALPERLETRDLRPVEETAVADVPLPTADFVVVDLETTGLSPQRDAIIEIAAVRVSGLERREVFETLVQPDEAADSTGRRGFGPSPRITELTGIDAAMLRDAPRAERVIPAFADWLARSPQAPFVAHNAAFDARFTALAFEAHGLGTLDRAVLCTQKLARRLLPRLGRYNLDHLCAHFGISNRARHRALGDAEATARALIDLLQIARSEHQIQTLGSLLELQRKRTRRGRSRARRPPSRRVGVSPDRA